jgi:hypothetical protein
MTLSMTVLRGLEDVENAALLSSCHGQISVRVQLFWGMGTPPTAVMAARERDADDCDDRSQHSTHAHFARRRRSPDKTCCIVLDMFL